MRNLAIFSIFFINLCQSKTYNYGITGQTEISTSSISLSPIEDRIEILEYGRKPKLRRKLHGVMNEKYGRPLVLSSMAKNEKVTKQRKRYQVPKPVKPPTVNEFEMELARQIEEDQLKFVADERNPMKYVVENGLLYKQSRFSPLARIEYPDMKPKKEKKPEKFGFRTNVFRGNINRQIPAIPLSSIITNSYKSPSFPIKREETDGKCYINRFGFRCCDTFLEALMLKSYEKFTRKHQNMEMNLQQISEVLRRDTRKVFGKNLEAIVSTEDFGMSIGTEFSCKIEIGTRRLVAMVFAPKFVNQSKNLPYHELSREDLNEPADLVVSRNGILVAQH